MRHGFLDVLERLFHELLRRCLRLRHAFFQHQCDLLLCRGDGLNVLYQFLLRLVVIADYFPCRVDDLFLQFYQLLPLTLLSLLLLLLSLVLTGGLAVGFFKWADFSKKHVTAHAPHLAVRPDVFSPDGINEQVIGFGLELLHGENVGELVLQFLALGIGNHDLLGFAFEVVSQSVTLQAEIIFDFCLDLQFFDRRNVHVATGKLDLHHRLSILEHIKRYAILILVLAAFGVHQKQIKVDRLFGSDVCDKNFRTLIVGLQFDFCLVVACGYELGVLHRLIENHVETNVTLFNGIDKGNIVECLLLEVGVIGRCDGCVGGFQSRELED